MLDDWATGCTGCEPQGSTKVVDSVVCVWLARVFKSKMSGRALLLLLVGLVAMSGFLGGGRAPAAGADASAVNGAGGVHADVPHLPEGTSNDGVSPSKAARAASCLVFAPLCPPATYTWRLVRENLLATLVSPLA